MKRFSPNIAVFGCFVLLGLVMMYPMPLNPTRLVIENDGTLDSLIFLWDFWWTKEALFHLHTSPFWTDHLYSPEGTSLVFHTLAFVHSLFSVPFLALFGDVHGAVLAYNVFIIFSYGLSGLGMYLLVRHLGCTKGGAVVAGLIFAFSPFHFWNLGRLHVLCIEFLPLYGYFFLRTIDSEKKGYALLCGLVLALTIYSSLPYFLYLVIFSAMYSVYLLFQKSRRIAPGLAARAGVATAVFGVLSFPYVYALCAEYFRNPYLFFSLDWSISHASDPTLVFFPNEYHQLYRKILGLEAPDVSPVALPFAIVTAGSFIGLVAIVLSIYAAVGRSRRTAVFWSVTALVFLILSFGPFLKWGGRQLPVPLPYLLLRRLIPLLAMSRIPSRYMAMVMMSTSVLSGLAVSRLAGEGGSRTLRTILVPGLIGLLVLAENWVPPVRFNPHPIPEIYYEIAKDADDCVVVDAPFNFYLERETMYYQLVHRKRVLYGAMPRPSQHSSYATSSPLLRVLQLRRNFQPVFPLEPDLFRGPMREIRVQRDKAELRRWGVKYIIFHGKYSGSEYGKYMKEAYVDFAKDLLKEYDPVSVREDAEHGITIYRLY